VEEYRVMERVLMVQTTFSDRKEAIEFSKKILETSLAACIQLSAEVESMYWWNGVIEKEKETVVTMKTLQSVYQQLETCIEKIHSYETPEILATAVEHVGTGYYQWLCEELKKGQNINE
jgi:periplasmic divalent cation tolerance protein